MRKMLFAIVVLAIVVVLFLVARPSQNGQDGKGPGVSPIPEAPTAGEETQPYVTVEESSQDVVEPAQELPPEEEEGVCQGGKWKAVPTRITTHPLGDGWKLLQVDLLFNNESEYWGTINLWDMHVTTEDGYVYENKSRLRVGDRYSIDPPNVYSDKVVAYAGRGLVYISALPPGLSVSGEVFVYDRGRVYPLSYVFEVPESQNHFVLTFGTGVSCILPGGEFGFERKAERLGQLTFDLDSEFGSTSFPLASGRTYGSIPGAIEIPDTGTFEVLGISRETYDEVRDLILLRFKFTNTGGYNAEGRVEAFLIGSDGLIRDAGCGEEPCSENHSTFHGAGYYTAGPGQVYFTDLGYLVPRNVDDLKFVWSDLAPWGVHLVFDLPDDF
ncbi:hypothetical protein IID21_04580 [Patescibacteria group bacterium]|nr:hypothetical protein [Patescibacteria group bacterium]